jgi:hypothetical protein
MVFPAPKAAPVLTKTTIMVNNTFFFMAHLFINS